MTITLPPDLITLARSQNGALTGTQVRGLSGDRALARLVRDGQLIRLWRNAYVVPPIVGPAANLEAARLTLGQPVTACLHTAAALHGFDISSDRDTHILADRDWSDALPGLVRHRSLPARPPLLMNGFWVICAAETAVRVACLQDDPAKVLAVLDAALARTGMRPNDLADVALELRIRGIKLVRELIPHADGRAESPGESWLRWVCIEAALPTPTPQLWVTTGAGRRYRLDLGWAARAGCEYDGVEFHTGEALTKDRARYNALARAGWQTQAVTSRTIWRDRRHLVADIRTMING